jgi:hypothetical protein
MNQDFECPRCGHCCADREWVGLTEEEINSVRHNRDWTAHWTDTTFARAIEAKLKEKNTEAAALLRERLAQPEQEPVAWMHTTGTGHVYFRKKPQDKVFNPQPVYTAPPKREWVGLTADEIWKCNKAKSGSAVEFHICYEHQNVLDFAESIEAKLREKNT